MSVLHKLASWCGPVLGLACIPITRITFSSTNRTQQFLSTTVRYVISTILLASPKSNHRVFHLLTTPHLSLQVSFKHADENNQKWPIFVYGFVMNQAVALRVISCLTGQLTWFICECQLSSNASVADLAFKLIATTCIDPDGHPQVCQLTLDPTRIAKHSWLALCFCVFFL